MLKAPNNEVQKARVDDGPPQCTAHCPFYLGREITCSTDKCICYFKNQLKNDLGCQLDCI